jgi:hypothetical protein
MEAFTVYSPLGDVARFPAIVVDCRYRPLLDGTCTQIHQSVAPKAGTGRDSAVIWMVTSRAVYCTPHPANQRSGRCICQTRMLGLPALAGTLCAMDALFANDSERCANPDMPTARI